MSAAVELTMTLQRDAEEVKTELADLLAQAQSPSAGAGAQEKIASARARLSTIETDEASASKTIQRDAALLQQRKSRKDSLEDEHRSARAAYETARAKLNEMLASAAFHGEKLQIVDPSIVPQRPSSPDVPLNLFLALVAGLFASAVYVGLQYSYSRLRLQRAEREYSYR
jgi:uncharacterized protein involved in exopolysaccharide biosynthesis